MNDRGARRVAILPLQEILSPMGSGGERWRQMLLRLLCLPMLLALSACGLFHRDHPMDPDIAISGLRMGPGEGFYQTIYIDLVITNPNRTAMKLDAITYRIRLQGRDLVNGTSREPLDVAAGGTARYTVPAGVNLLSGLGFIKDFLQKQRDSINYEIDATLEPSGMFSLPIRVRKSDSISLTH